MVGRRPADVVAHAGVLDLQHVGAEVGQQQRAEPARQQPGEVEHLDVGERAHAALTPRPASGRAEQLARLGHGRHAPAHVLHDPPRPRDQVAVRARHLAVGQVEVVLQAHAHVAAQRGRAGHQPPLVAADPDHAPVVAALGPARDLVGHVGEVARRGPDAAGHPHHAVDLQRLRQQAHVDQRVEVRHVPGVEALVLRPDAELVHDRQELDDRVERVLEDGLEDELLAPLRVLGVVHRAHVQRGHVGAQLAQVLDSLLDRHPDRAGRVVDDHVVDGAVDRLGDRPEVLDLERRHALWRARVDVDHRCALVHRPLRLGGVLLGRVRDRRALLAAGHGTRDRANDDRRVLEPAHAGLPCRTSAASAA